MVVVTASVETVVMTLSDTPELPAAVYAANAGLVGMEMAVSNRLGFFPNEKFDPVEC